MKPKNVKTVKLCGLHDGHQRVPELRISGIWLDKLVFDIGRTVEITSSEGETIIYSTKIGEKTITFDGDITKADDVLTIL